MSKVGWYQGARQKLVDDFVGLKVEDRKEKPLKRSKVDIGLGFAAAGVLAGTGVGLTAYAGTVDPLTVAGSPFLTEMFSAIHKGGAAMDKWVLEAAKNAGAWLQHAGKDIAQWSTHAFHSVAQFSSAHPGAVVGIAIAAVAVIAIAIIAAVVIAQSKNEKSSSDSFSKVFAKTLGGSDLSHMHDRLSGSANMAECPILLRLVDTDSQEGGSSGQHRNKQSDISMLNQYAAVNGLGCYFTDPR